LPDPFPAFQPFRFSECEPSRHSQTKIAPATDPELFDIFICVQLSYFNLLSSETESFVRPFALLLASTFLPFAVCIRFLKP
jgi:hypothetical protein